jgi:GT2 family glycosyltransferase
MLDADDRLAPGALEALRRPLDAAPGLGFAYGIAEFFGDWSGPLVMPAFDPYRLLYRSLVPATSLVRRELFADVGGFDPEIEGYEDWDFYLGAVERGWGGQRVEEVTFFYRRHGQSRLEQDRRAYRRAYRALRRKHRTLFLRAGALAAESDLRLPGRLAYRIYFAWRPLPAWLERRLYRLVFR